MIIIEIGAKLQETIFGVTGFGVLSFIVWILIIKVNERI